MEESGKNLLTLKNLYRLFTQRDYPVYSQGVLQEKARKGMTILKFWDSVVLPEWKSDKYGKLIWKEEGQRSRFSSELFHRKDVFPYYSAYLQEIMAGMSPEKFLWQMRLFQLFLTEKAYHAQVFREKMRSFIRLCAQQDPCFYGNVVTYFQSYLEPGEEEELPSVFLDSWVLTALFLHACAGPQMHHPQLEILRSDGRYSPEALERIARESGYHKIRCVLSPGSEMSMQAVTSAVFFGRERELYDLTEDAREGAKVLVTGGGGIGKTELLRQLRKEAVSAGWVDAIAEIQYEGGLAKSFAKAFQHSPGDSAEERFREILYEIRVSRQKWLLLIDNADFLPEELPLWQEMASLEAGVVVTSRMQSCAGFQSYLLEPLSAKASWLTFRSHYRQRMSEGEERTLMEALSAEAMRYPLVLSMLGRAARYNGWTVPEVISRQAQGLGMVMWYENGNVYQIRKICQDLYQDSTLSGKEKALIHLLSVLPYRSYTLSLLARLMESTDEESLCVLLDQLYHRGWLEKGDTGYSLHPLLAEEMVQRGCQEADYVMLWRVARNWILPVSLTEGGDARPSKELLEMASLVVHAAGNMQGEISPELLGLCLDASWQMTLSGEGGRGLCEHMKALFSRCPKRSWQQFAMLAMITCACEQYEVQALETCIREGFETGAAHAEMVSLCLLAIPRLAETDENQRTAQAFVEKLMQVSEEDREPLQMLLSFISLSQAMNQGNTAQALQHFMQMRKSYALCADARCVNLLHQAWTNTVFLLLVLRSETDRAKELYADYAAQEFSCLRFEQEILRLRMIAAYEDFEGRETRAIESARQMLDLIERRSGKQTRTYLITRYDLAMYLRKNGDMQEALKLYEEMLRDGDREIMNPDYYPLLLINAGVAYWMDGHIARAQELLEKGLHISEEREEEFTKANAAFWLAKIARERKDTKREKRYLETARSFFVETYGMEHEKSAYLLSRLEELEAAH